MKQENKKIKMAAIASGAAIVGAFGTTANAAELLSFEDLGTGSEIRSSLISADAMNAFTSNTDVEFECGEGKCGEDKSGEHKCGEGKCGEKGEKKEGATEEKAEMKPVEETKKEGSSEMMMTTDKKETKMTESKSDNPKN